MRRRRSRLGPFEDWTEATVWGALAVIAGYFGYHWLVWLL